MVGTASTPGAYDPLASARPDEPIFSLMARDPDAPPTVTFWAQLRRNRAIKRYGTDPKREKDRKALNAEFLQCAEAEEVAMVMTEWRKGEGEHEGEGRANYQEVKKTEEQLAAAKLAKRQEELRRHLREAAYHLCEVKDALPGLALVEEIHVALLRQSIEHANHLADELEPKREWPAAEAEAA